MAEVSSPQAPSSNAGVPKPLSIQPGTQSPLPLPQILTDPSASAPPILITQGAEALLYRTTYLLPSLPCALKYRPPKPYRHSILDARLTKHRILSEARVLVKCRKEGVRVPAVYALDEARGWIMMEWIDGEVVRARINEWLKSRKDSRKHGGNDDGGADGGDEDAKLIDLMWRIGRAVGVLHSSGVVHGDLTTSNLMLRQWQGAAANGEGREQNPGIDELLEGEIILIDFGLASQSTQDEDRAVDLYVLERAFGSTHPGADGLFSEVLKAYGQSFKGANVALRRLEEVRMRGRKRSMLG